MITSSSLVGERQGKASWWPITWLKPFSLLFTSHSHDLLKLNDLTPVAHSSLLALGYEAAEAEFIWETLQHDLGASYASQLVFIQREQALHG